MKTQNTSEDEGNALGGKEKWTVEEWSEGEFCLMWGDATLQRGGNPATLYAIANAHNAALAPSPTSQPNEKQESANATTPAATDQSTHISGASTLHEQTELETLGVRLAVYLDEESGQYPEEVNKLIIEILSKRKDSPCEGCDAPATGFDPEGVPGPSAEQEGDGILLSTELHSFLTAIINSERDFMLPNGSRLQHATANFLDAIGKRLFASAEQERGLCFSKRINLAKQVVTWCEQRKIPTVAHNIITALDSINLINRKSARSLTNDAAKEKPNE